MSILRLIQVVLFVLGFVFLFGAIGNPSLMPIAFICFGGILLVRLARFIMRD
jgi:hypothetical protein